MQHLNWVAACLEEEVMAEGQAADGCTKEVEAGGDFRGWIIRIWQCLGTLYWWLPLPIDTFPSKRRDWICWCNDSFSAVVAGCNEFSLIKSVGKDGEDRESEYISG